MGKTLVEQALDRGDGSVAIAVDQAADEYLKLLQRNASPRKGDPERLLQLMAALRKEPARVRADLRAIQQNITDREYVKTAEQKLQASEQRIARWREMQERNELTAPTLRLLDAEMGSANLLRRRIREKKTAIVDRELRLARIEAEPEAAGMMPGIKSW